MGHFVAAVHSDEVLPYMPRYSYFEVDHLYFCTRIADGYIRLSL